VLSWLGHISSTNELLVPVVELERRLLGMMLHACTTDIKDTGMLGVEIMVVIS